MSIFYSRTSFIFVILLLLNCSLNSLADDEQLGDGFADFQQNDINKDGVVNENESGDIFWSNLTDNDIVLNGTGNFTDAFDQNNATIEQATAEPTTVVYDFETTPIPTVSNTTTNIPNMSNISTTSVPGTSNLVYKFVTTTTTPIPSTSDSVGSNSVAISTTTLPIATKLSNALYPSTSSPVNLSTKTQSTTVSAESNVTKDKSPSDDITTSTTILPTQVTKSPTNPIVPNNVAETQETNSFKSEDNSDKTEGSQLKNQSALDSSLIQYRKINLTTVNSTIPELNNTGVTVDSLQNRNMTVEVIDTSNNSHSIVLPLTSILFSFILSILFI